MKKEVVLICMYFIVASLVATYPLVLHITDSLPHAGDELLLTWILNWDIYSFFHNIFGIYNTNIFYPYPNTLAYSDAFLPFAVIGIIPWIIFHQSTAVYNFLVLFAFSSSGFCTYLLVRYLAKSWHAGIISGTLVPFSTYAITKTMHLQIIGIFLVPLALFFFFKFIDTKQIRYFIYLCLCTVLQAANSFLPVYFLFFSFSFFIIYYFFTDKKIFWLFFQQKVMLLSAISIIFITLLGIPYFQVSQEFGYVRDIRDTIQLAVRPEYLFWPSDRTRLQPLLLNTIYKNDTGPFTYDGYVGFAFFSLYFSAGILYFTKAKKNIPFVLPFFLLSLIAIVTSLGPVFQWGGKVLKHPFIIPLPYALFYYFIPGFKGIRNSARWEMLFLIAGSVMIGVFLGYYFKKGLKKWAMIITISVCLLVFGEINLPMNVTPMPTYEKIPHTYHFLKTLPSDAVIVEMPAYVWNMAPYAMEELMRQYYSTVDFKRRINGGSGFDPPTWEPQIRALMAIFPSDTSIIQLKKMGVTYIVLHKKEFDKLVDKKFSVNNIYMKPGNEITEMLEKNKKVKVLKQIDNDIIYQIL